MEVIDYNIDQVLRAEKIDKAVYKVGNNAMEFVQNGEKEERN